MAPPISIELEALCANPANARLLARVLAAPSRPATPEERAIFARPLPPRPILLTSDGLLALARGHIPPST